MNYGIMITQLYGGFGLSFGAFLFPPWTTFYASTEQIIDGHRGVVCHDEYRTQDNPLSC